MTARPWLVLGAGGLLGTDLVERLTATGRSVVALGHADLEITDAAALAAALDRHRPAVLVNAAAFTAVDAAEEDEAAAEAVNAAGAAAVGAAAAAAGVRLLHLSTDYVFAGDAAAPYDEDDPVAPVSAYGRTKAAGERAVLTAHPQGAAVVRTAWLYGRHGRCFPRTILRLAAERERLRVVDDQIGQPTWTQDLADALIALGDSAATGILHATNSGSVSWCGFARALLAGAGLDPDRVDPVVTAEFPTPARRPAYSVLGDRRWREAGLPALPSWQDALARARPWEWDPR